jgi:hypothetical protein
MNRPISLGFLEPSEHRVQPDKWLVIAGVGLEYEAPEVLPDWDYFTPIHAVRRLKVDLAKLLEESGLGAGTKVNGLVTWHATGTGLRGAGSPVGLVDGDNTIEVVVPGYLLGQRLNLSSCIVVGAEPERANPLAARRPGSFLWRDSYQLILEGSGSRFPIVPLPFDDAGLAGGRAAGWCLMLDSEDLSDSGIGNLRLYLNSSQPAIRALLANPDGQRDLAAYLQYDVTRQLLTLALRHPDLDLTQEYDPGSLGELLALVVERLFPARDLGSIRGDRDSSMGEFESEVQARAGLLR